MKLLAAGAGAVVLNTRGGANINAANHRNRAPSRDC